MNAPQTKAQDKPQVAVKGGLVAYLEIDGAQKAAKFYEAAFGGKTVDIYPPDEQGRTMHVHLHVNGSSLMMSDPFPEFGYPHQPPQGFTMTLMVDDCDAAHQRAVDAGCDNLMAPEDMFWGDRYAQVRDPFGVRWAFNQPKG